MRNGPILAAAALSLLAAACGKSEPAAPAADEQAAGPAPTAAAPSAATEISDEEKQKILASLPAPYNTADVENGKAKFGLCQSCHTITPGGPNMTGPNLWGVFGRKAGTHPGFNYSKAVQEADITWDGERIDHWLENPRTFLPGNKMSFAGLPDATDRRDLIAWLQVNTSPAA